MKSFIKFLAITALALVLTILPASTVHANKVATLVSNPDAEQYVQEQLLAGQAADLLTEFSDSNDRVIGGDFLSKILTSEEMKRQQTAVIRHAVIAGDLSAELSSLPFDIFFDNCQFEGGINLARAETGEFKIEESTVSGFLRMDRASIAGDLVLANSTFQSGVGLSEISITGDLIGVGSQFLGTKLDENMDYPFELYRAHVNLAADFSDAVISGRSIFDNSHFNEIYFSNTVFLDEANFNDAVVDTNSMFEGTVFEGAANFNNFYSGNYANFTGVTFRSDATFDFSTSARFLDFVDTTFEQASSFYYATAGWADIINVGFNGPVNFEGTHITENFEINDSQYEGDEPFYFTLVNIEGAAWFRNFASPAGINATYGQFGILEFTSDAPIELRSLDVSSSKINNELILGNTVIESFTANNLSIGQSTIFENVNITDKLDLGNARLGYLQVDQFQWPHVPTSFILHGMTYTDIDLGEQGLTEETWHSLLLLVNQSAYSPQAYKALSQFLIDKGHSDWAAEVEVAGKRRERDETMPPLSGAWLWSWFLDIFVGYGHRPFLAFLWSALVISFGAFIYWKEENMVIMDTSEAKPAYNPVIYSIALFIPYIDLGIEDKWEPKPSRRFASYYKYIHRILGLVLLPIALLTFGGVIG